ncbi:hypothetical protein BCR37DRAFT_402462 [Protomyces lactucae-debilis]|uniref:GDP-Man:Man(3)GlcNAc(2)-PP-Dol alpha-1,2-mannosyltransferase n=1 Tax=Protomyces lactucae-debilis TaxID=2754530 RepID=A0A1Y2FIY8_PROLT|nr:uncharacterized protein BCR37DRAFT_402462 [Protomyces lactucae-debilis]ORY83910.1 hypothetical protein BCR37DRAFT_402462 [Protomyces lactucae-debilis]
MNAQLIATVFLGTVLVFVVFAGCLRNILLPSLRRKLRQQSLRRLARPVVVGFFHPYCNAGGGGERVLWAAIRSTHAHFPETFCVVFTGDVESNQDAIISRARDAFGIEVDASRLHIVHLDKRYLVSPETWPRFTLIGQSLGSLPLVYEALTELAPDVFIDTMGYAFTYPLVSHLLGIPVATYTHYPTISSDMLNQANTSGLRLLYWKAFARLYATVGSYADFVMANSTWTRNHLASLWHCDERLSIVYPPCNTATLTALPVSTARQKAIVCLAQFRREKNHEMILRAFSKFLQLTSDHGDKRLVFIGTVRNTADRTWIAHLKKLARDLRIDAQVEFKEDVPWPEVVETLGQAYIGCNAMWNEHFGIGVVEYMAAGLICVVHDSAGPKLDIVTPFDGGPTGFHATDEDSFADAFSKAFSLPEEACMQMRRRAQQAAGRFSEDVFDGAWQQCMSRILRMERRHRLA